MTTVDYEKPVATQDTATNNKESCANTCEGTVVSLTGNRLVMTDKEGKKYAHTLAKDAKLICEGKVCQAEDLKAGSKIRVTTHSDDRNVAIGIESLDKHAESTQCCG